MRAHSLKRSPRGLQTGFEHNPLAKWDDLSAEIESEKLFRRAIYNTQIDNLDENIGRLPGKLKTHGICDDRLILLMSDNGCSGEMVRLGTRFLAERDDHVDAQFEDGRKMAGTKMEPEGWTSKEKVGGVGYKKLNYEQWKKESGWATSQGRCWASYSNTPFRKFKKFVHEVGVATPLIARWPSGIASSGEIASAQVFHLMDVMPTLLEVAGAEYPGVFQGKKHAAGRHQHALHHAEPCRRGWRAVVLLATRDTSRGAKRQRKDRH